MTQLSCLKGANSYIGKNASGAYSYVVEQAKKADKKVVTTVGSFLAKYPNVGNFLAKHPKTTTGLRYSAYAVAATLTGYGVYKAYKASYKAYKAYKAGLKKQTA